MADLRIRDLVSLAPSDEPRPVAADVSVVIPTVGRDILESCLAYLVSGTLWPASVVVVDQGRWAKVAGMMERLRAIGIHCEYLPSFERGRSAGINRGLERVSTRFVTITDDDCFVSPSWLENMTVKLRAQPDRILTGRVELAGEEEGSFSVMLDTQPALHTKPTVRLRPFIGGNVGMAMSLVTRIGPFDEHPCLASAEDADYGHRALRLGIPIAYDPEVVLYHYHWRDAQERAARYGDYARSQGGYYGTHLRHGDCIVLMQAARDLLRSPVRWLRGFVSRDRELIENGRASTLNLLPGIVAGLRRKTFPAPWRELTNARQSG
jgi:GT2 family glycosyltransferase